MALANRVFGQEIVPVEAIFVHGFEDLHDEMIDFVADVYKKSGAKYVVLNGEKEFEFEAPGFAYWKEKLSERGVLENLISGVTPAHQTREEAIGFMNFAKENNIKKGIVISAPTYVIRAFLTNLSLINEWKLDIDLYPMTMKDMDWRKEIVVRGLSNDSPSEPGPRFVKFAGEWGKIIQYRQIYENGNANYSIASVKEGLEYLKKLSD
ncbi:MAG: hypothetical protein AAB907_02055 [Patescibacteria group bacterium]